MTRAQLEHIIRAAAATADTRDIVVVGSQSLLATFPDAPPELTRSVEADVFPRDTEFVRAMVRRSLVSTDVILQRLLKTSRLSAEALQLAIARLQAGTV